MGRRGRRERTEGLVASIRHRIALRFVSVLSLQQPVVTWAEYGTLEIGELERQNFDQFAVAYTEIRIKSNNNNNKYHSS